MEIKDSYKLVRHIIDGKYSISVDKFTGVIRDASTLEFIEWQTEYQQNYEKAIKFGALSDSEAIKYAVERKEWEEDWDLKVIEKQLEMIKEQMEKNAFKLDVFDKLKLQYKKLTDEHTKINDAYNRIMSAGTARFSAVKSIIYSKVNTLCQLNKGIISSENDYYTLYNVIEENEINTGQLRELARSNPWNTIYRASKDHIGILFNSLTNLTMYQEEIIRWSQLYEYVYNNPDKPDDYTIRNDKLLDKWLENQNRKDKAKQMTASKDFQEVFVMSDRRGAQKVMDLNDDKTKQEIQNKLKIITTKGDLDEVEINKELKNRSI